MMASKPTVKFIFFASFLRCGAIQIAAMLLLISAASAQSSALLKAAEQGNANAQYQLAIDLLKEQGSPPNYPQAVAWLQRAAEQGHSQAQYSLALRYLFGQGVKKNPQMAVGLLKPAAEKGLADAQFSLGLRYLWGQGVKKDPAEAGSWFRQAAAQGHQKAAESLAKLPSKQAGPEPAMVEPNDSEQLIAAYVQTVIAGTEGNLSRRETKLQLEEKMTAAEVMLALQRVIKHKQNQLNEGALIERFARLAEQMESAEDFFLAGNRLVKTGDLSLAIAAYEKSLQLAPNSISSHRNLASAYVHNGENRKALEMLRRAIELGPGQATMHASRGLIFFLEGELIAALAEYRQAASLNPGIGWIYSDMAEIFRQQQNYPAAWKAIRQAELLGFANQRISSRLSGQALADEISLQEALQADMHLRQLVLATRQAAATALQELQSGKDFSQLAQTLSLEQYHRNGGYWGPYRPEQFAVQFTSVLNELAPLDYSPIIETDVGFHILQKFPVFPELIAER